MNKKEFDTSGEDQKEGKVKTKDKLKGKTKKAKTGQNKESSSHSSDTQNFEKKKKKVASKKKNAEKKMKHYNGKAYENFSCYKLCHKIFLEDIKEIDADNIITNKEFELDEIFDEIILKGFKLEFKDSNDFQNAQNQLKEEYKKLIAINDKLTNKSGESSSGYETEKKDINDTLDTIKKMEFDLVLKNIEGKYINNYLKKIKDDCHQYIDSFSIEDEQNYNLFFEITFSSKDVLYKKIQQILKYAVFLNFLYNTSKILKTLAEQKEKFLKKDDKLNLLINFFNDKFKFIDLTKKTLLFIVSNGDKNDFNGIIESLQNNKDIVMLDDLNKECSKKYNLYFNYSPFDPEKLKDEIINSINKEKENKNQIKEEDISKIIQEEIKKKLDKIEQLEKVNKEMQEKMLKLEKELETIKIKNKDSGENINKSEEKKDDEKKENGD